MFGNFRSASCTVIPDSDSKKTNNSFFKHPLQQTFQTQNMAQNSRVSSICSSVVSGNVSVEELIEFCSSRVIENLQLKEKQQLHRGTDFRQTSFIEPEKKSQWGIRTYGAFFICFLFIAVFMISLYDNMFMRKKNRNIKNTSNKFFEMRAKYAESVD